MLAAGSARADGKEDSETLFAEARKLQLAGQCDQAIDVFQRALAAWPEGLGALRNIADCQQELGRYASARRSWWELRRRVLQSNEEKYRGWDREAEEAHARLGPETPRLTVVLVGERLETVRLAIDGEEVAAALVGTELERDPGKHQIEAFRGEGQRVVTQAVTLAEGAKETVRLAIPPPPPSPTLPPAGGGGQEPVDEGIDPAGATGIALLAVGGLSAVAAGVSLGVRQAALAELDEACPQYKDHLPCPATVADAVDRGETASALVNVFAATTLAGLGVGAVLVVTSGDDEEPKVSVRVAPIEGGGAISLGGRFE